MVYRFIINKTRRTNASEFNGNFPSIKRVWICHLQNACFVPAYVFCFCFFVLFGGNFVISDWNVISEMGPLLPCKYGLIPWQARLLAVFAFALRHSWQVRFGHWSRDSMWKFEREIKSFWSPTPCYILFHLLYFWDAIYLLTPRCCIMRSSGALWSEHMISKQTSGYPLYIGIAFCAHVYNYIYATLCNLLIRKSAYLCLARFQLKTK